MKEFILSGIRFLQKERFILSLSLSGNTLTYKYMEV